MGKKTNSDDDDRAIRKILQHEGEPQRQSKTDYSFKTQALQRLSSASLGALGPCVVHPRPRSLLMIRSSDTWRQLHRLLPSVFHHPSYDDHLVRPVSQPDKPPLSTSSLSCRRGGVLVQRTS